MLSRVCSIVMVLGVVMLMGMAATAEEGPALKIAPGLRQVAAATEDVGSSYLAVTPTVGFQRATLRIAGPGDVSLTQSFGRGDQIRVDLLESAWTELSADSEDGAAAGKREAALPDGRYRYEVRFLSGDGAEKYFTGMFFIENGLAVSRDQIQSRLSATRVELNEGASSPDAQAKTMIETDWITIADDANNGRVELLTYTDLPSAFQWFYLTNMYGDMFLTSATSPHLNPAEFTVVRGPGAGIGINTKTPLGEIDIATTVPEIVFTDTGTGALWYFGMYDDDMEFIDRTGAQTIPFTIEQGAPNNAFYMISNGNVGLGTSAPADRLTVVNPTGNASMRFDSGASANFFLDRGNLGSLSRFVFMTNGAHHWTVGMVNDGTSDFHFTPDTVNDAITIKRSNRYVGFGNQKNPAYPIHHSSGARLTAGGVWADASSLKLKENIRDLDVDEAFAALANLKPVRFNYKNSPNEDYVGFIAEDVPELVAMEDREGLSPMDLVGVLTRVVQEQQSTIEALTQRIEKLEAK